jgi:Mg2+ and Co2+ transporter CorA
MPKEITIAGIPWRHVVHPSSEELTALLREIKVTPRDAALIMEGKSRAELSYTADYFWLRTEIPTFDKRLHITLGVAVDCLVTSERLYTITPLPVPIMERLVDECERLPERHQDEVGTSPLELLLYILERAAEGTQRKLDRLSKYIDIAEDAVFQGNERKMVEEISFLMRDAMDLGKIIQPQYRLLAGMPKHSFITQATALAWRRVYDRLEKLWDNLEMAYESIKQLDQTNDRLLQHKENQLLRLISFYSIIAIPLWMILNIFEPRSEQATLVDIVGYIAILTILVLALLFILWRFHRKRIL